jgi:hypothetical protein
LRSTIDDNANARTTLNTSPLTTATATEIRILACQQYQSTGSSISVSISNGNSISNSNRSNDSRNPLTSTALTMNKNHDKSMWPDPGFSFGFGAAPAVAAPAAASSSANDFTWTTSALTMDKKLPAMWPDPGFSFGAAPAAMWPDSGFSFGAAPAAMWPDPGFTFTTAPAAVTLAATSISANNTENKSSSGFAFVDFGAAPAASGDSSTVPFPFTFPASTPRHGQRQLLIMTPQQLVAYDNSAQRSHTVAMLAISTIEKICSDSNVTEHQVRQDISGCQSHGHGSE